MWTDKMGKLQLLSGQLARAATYYVDCADGTDAHAAAFA